jgi:hypothetical protein
MNQPCQGPCGGIERKSEPRTSSGALTDRVAFEVLDILGTRLPVWVARPLFRPAGHLVTESHAEEESALRAFASPGCGSRAGVAPPSIWWEVGATIREFAALPRSLARVLFRGPLQ